MLKKVMLVFGTRPEAIKMAPLVHALKSNGLFECKVCVTGQHRQMLDSVLDLFDIDCDYDLNIMKPHQNLTSIICDIIQGLESVFALYRPDIILVHGDTSTSFAATLSAYYHQIKVGHVEAGLRTGNIYSPWPEEGNRKLTGAIANYHFCPTLKSYENLINEGIKEEMVFVTGNTVIDSLFYIREKIKNCNELEDELQSEFNYLDNYAKIVLITAHRRENFGAGFDNICQAIKKAALSFPEVVFVYPVHLNPNVQEPVHKHLKGICNIKLIPPQDYLPFVYLMDRSYLILTDSGGIQEEAPSLGKPVLVMRDTTERPEAIISGTVKLVGTDTEVIFNEIKELLTDHSKYLKMSEANNPYGDGDAAQKIVELLSMPNS